jgi:sugar phosphate isomerase/epimerase
MTTLGINLSFAVKRWPEPEAWARIVREELELNCVQFSFDLLNPWWPDEIRSPLAARVVDSVNKWDLVIHSAQLGLAEYTYNGLLHPDPDGRKVAMEWWNRSIALASEMGVHAVGGPLGALSVSEMRSPEVREERYAELISSIQSVSESAKAAGLEALLVEPTPLAREVPSSVEESRRLIADLEGCCALPVYYIVDVGHALYQPLYGRGVSMREWLEGIGSHIGAFHLQNTDFQSDSHSGWPSDRGLFDVGAFAGDLREARLQEVPIFLELIYPIELADEATLANVVSSVEHCRRALAGVG